MKRATSCFRADNYVHRLVASKTDGKMVQYECEGDSCQDEKIDALQLEVCLLGMNVVCLQRNLCLMKLLKYLLFIFLKCLPFAVFLFADQSAGISAHLLGK